MANRFTLQTPGPTKAERDLKERQVRLAERQADPGYQFLNAGLTTMAQTLGALAVNAAGYELFGGRTKDELAAKNLDLQRQDFAFRKDRFGKEFDLAEKDFDFRKNQFSTEMDFKNKEFDENKRKSELASAVGSAESFAKNFAANSHLMSPGAVEAAVIKFKSTQNQPTKQESPPVQVPADETGATQPAPEQPAPVEAYDPFKNLSPEARLEAEGLVASLQGMYAALERIPPGPARDAALASLEGQFGVSAAGAAALRDLVGKRGVSITRSQGQTTVSRSQRAASPARDQRFYQNEAEKAAAEYYNFKQATETSKAGERNTIIPGFDRDFGTAEKQQKELARLKAVAQAAQRKSRGAPGRDGMAIVTPAARKKYSPTSGDPKSKERIAEYAGYVANVKNDPTYRNSRYAIGFKQLASSLGLSREDMAVVNNPDSTETDILTVLQKYRSNLDEQKRAEFSNRLIQTAFQVDQGELKSPSQRSSKSSQLTNDQFFSKIERGTAFSNFKAYPPPLIGTADSVIAEIRDMLEKTEITGNQFEEAVNRSTSMTNVLSYLKSIKKSKKTGR